MTGLAIGVGAVIVLPLAAPVLRSLAKTAIKGGILAYQGGAGLVEGILWPRLARKSQDDAAAAWLGPPCGSSCTAQLLGHGWRDAVSRFADWRANGAAVMSAVAVIIFAAAVAVGVTSLAQEAPPSVEGPRYGTCVAQHPNDFRGVCAELRRAFKAETMARHGYVDETIADPVAYCRSQMAVKGDPELEALAHNNYGAMYSQCLAYAVRKNSDPEMLQNRKMNEDNAECMAQAAENTYLGRMRTPNEFYTQCMAASGWPGQWLQ